MSWPRARTPHRGDCRPPYDLALVKAGALVVLAMNDLTVLRWEDDGVAYGPRLAEGVLGFRREGNRQHPAQAAIRHRRLPAPR